MDYLVITYALYITLTIGLTFWVGNVLFNNGRTFLKTIFGSDEELCDSVNRLLLVGFYLVNFGYVLYNLQTRKAIHTFADCIELLSVKVGFIVIVLGIMHFINIFTLFYLRRKALKADEPTVKAVSIGDPL